jgi:hypothetical protein
MTLPIDKFKEELHKKLHPEPVAEIREDGAPSEEYEDVVFLQGEEADQYLKMIEEQGAEETIRVLASNFYHPGEHGKQNGNPAGSSDKTFTSQDGKFILSWNERLGYVGLVAKDGITENCGAGTASVPASCGAGTGVARVKAPIGGVERRIGETDEHEGNEEPQSEPATPSASGPKVELPTWLDTEAVESAAHFMFRGFGEDTVKKFVEDACTNCSGTEEAIQRLKEYSKTNKVVANKSFNEEELDSLADYRHSLRGKLLGKSKDAILDPDSYVNFKKTNEADVGVAPTLGSAVSRILPTQGQMSVAGSDNDMKRANLDVEIAKKNAELAGEKDPAKRKKIYNDLAKLEGEKSMLKEAESFPSNFGDKSTKDRYYKDFPKVKELTDKIGIKSSPEEIVKELSAIMNVPEVNIKLSPKPFPTGERGIFVKVDRSHPNPLHYSRGLDKSQQSSTEHIGDAWPVEQGFIFKNNQNPWLGNKLSESNNSVEFERSGRNVAYSLEEAIETLAMKLGVEENAFEVVPTDNQDIKAIFLNTTEGKEKVADVVESHGGKFLINLNHVGNPNVENMLAKTKVGSMAPQDESAQPMTEKDDIDKKTIVGVLLTAGPQKVSKAFTQAANQGQEQFYQLLDGMDVDGLKILSKGVQGAAATNTEKGVETPTLDNAPVNDVSKAGGVEPGDSSNPAAGGSELKDL